MKLVEGISGPTREQENNLVIFIRRSFLNEDIVLLSEVLATIKLNDEN